MIEGLMIGIGVGIGFCVVVIPALLLMPRREKREKQHNEMIELMRERNHQAERAAHYLRVCALGYVKRSAAERVLRFKAGDVALLEDEGDRE